MDREYIESVITEYVNEYVDNGDIWELIKKVTDKDKECLPIALYYALLSDITKQFEAIVDSTEESLADLGKLFENNKDMIDKMSNIIEYNTPMIKRG